MLKQHSTGNIFENEMQTPCSVLGEGHYPRTELRGRGWSLPEFIRLPGM